MDAKEFNVKIINTVKWTWEQDEFSFLSRPRSSYGLLAVEKGRVDYIMADKTISLNEGCFIFLPKDSIYTARFHINQGEVRTLLVNFDTDDNVNLPLPDFYNGFDDSLQLVVALKRLCELGNEEEEFYLKRAYFYLCFHVMYNNYIHNRHSVDIKLIAGAKKLLKDGEMSVEEIAEELKISSSNLRKKFKEATNQSPSEWRNERKIETAKGLLISSDLSIDEIARKTGFYDTPYFYKKFYAIVGMTPKKYRETEMLF